MTGKQVLLFQGGIIVLLLMSIGIFGFLGNNASETTNRVEKKQDELEKKFDAFTNKWDNRIKISNNINNETQKKIVGGVDHIITLVQQEFDNLTQHRVVTNLTFDDIKEQQNLTKELIAEFNQTNEAERSRAVDRIVERIVERIDGLATSLNVTIGDTKKQPQFDDKNLTRLFEQFLTNNTS